jgi:hypothetical protein
VLGAQRRALQRACAGEQKRKRDSLQHGGESNPVLR